MGDIDEIIFNQQNTKYKNKKIKKYKVQNIYNQKYNVCCLKHIADILL